MIRKLRQRHRHVTIALGVFLAVAFVIGIAARKNVPGMTSLPAGLIVSPQQYAIPVWERADLFAKVPIQVRLLRQGTGADRFAVQLSEPKDFAKPDLIVYLGPRESAPHRCGAGQRVFAGRFQPVCRAAVAVNCRFGQRVLALYSWADQESVVRTRKSELYAEGIRRKRTKTACGL